MSELLPPSRTVSAVRRNGRLLRAFLRYGLQRNTAYRAHYWAKVVNTAVKAIAIAIVWRAFFTIAPGEFPVPLRMITAYAVIAAVLSEVFDWWKGPHFYLAERVRSGTITGDLLRPVSLPLQLFAIWTGESVALLLTVGLPVLVGAFVVFDLAGPASADVGAMTVVSFGLGFVLLFCCSFLVGMVVLKTLNLLGIMHIYHAALTLLSGFWIPLWFFPEPLRFVAELLPFKGIFYTPLAIYTGYLAGSDAVLAVVHQAVWVVVGIFAVRLAWRAIRRRLVVQGG